MKRGCRNFLARVPSVYRLNYYKAAGLICGGNDVKQYRAKHQGHVERTIAEAMNLGLTRIGLTILLIIVAILALASLVTTYIFPYTNFETPFNSFSYVLVSLPLIGGALYFITKFSYFNRVQSSRVIAVCASISFLFSIIWVSIFSSYPPNADQWIAVNCAQMLHNNEVDLLNQSGLLQVYPFQTGLVLWNELVGSLFGFSNWTAFRLLGCISVPIIVLFLSRTAELVFDNSKVGSVCAILSTVFLPLSCYASFIYGTLPSLAASLIAFWFQIRAIRIQANDAGKCLRLGIISCVMFFIALFFKLNSLIFLIAAEAVWFFTAILRKSGGLLIICMLNIAVYFSSSFIPNYIVENRTGIEVGSGVPKTAWIVMGLQESDRAAGWYNEYVTQYWGAAIDGSYDAYQNANKQIEADLSERINEFCSNPLYAVDFFSEKVLTQWSEPTFQSLWCSFTGTGTVSQDGKLAGVNASFDGDSLLQSSLLDGMLHKGYVVYCDTFQSIVYIMIVAGLVFMLRRPTELHSAIFAIALFGGIIFHVLWEAKSCYTFTYFLTALPIAAQGILYIRGFIMRNSTTRTTLHHLRDAN